MPILAMTVTDTEEMLEGAPRALSRGYKNVAILIYLPRVIRNKSDPRCKRILCNDISLNVPSLIKRFEIFLKLCLLLRRAWVLSRMLAAVPLADVINWFVYRRQINVCFLLCWGGWNREVLANLVPGLWLALLILFRSLLLGPCAERLLRKRLLMGLRIGWLAGSCEQIGYGFAFILSQKQF